MRERAVQHVGDDLEVTARLHSEAARGCDPVLAQQAQRAERRMRGPAWPASGKLLLDSSQP